MALGEDCVDGEKGVIVSYCYMRIGGPISFEEPLGTHPIVRSMFRESLSRGRWIDAEISLAECIKELQLNAFLTPWRWIVC